MSEINEGNIDMIHVAAYIGKGKAMRDLLCARPLLIVSAAFRAFMRKGMWKLFASVIRLSTKPGQITDTLMPSLWSAPRKASPYDLTAALLAL